VSKLPPSGARADRGSHEVRSGPLLTACVALLGLLAFILTHDREHALCSIIIYVPVQK
jgi:hypothetical protein